MVEVTLTADPRLPWLVTRDGVPVERFASRADAWARAEFEAGWRSPDRRHDGSTFAAPPAAGGAR